MAFSREHEYCRNAKQNDFPQEQTSAFHSAFGRCYPPSARSRSNTCRDNMTNVPVGLVGRPPPSAS